MVTSVNKIKWYTNTNDYKSTKIKYKIAWNKKKIIENKNCNNQIKTI